VAHNAVLTRTSSILRKPLVLNNQQPAAEDGGASPAICATSEGILSREVPAHTAVTARLSPPNDEKTPKDGMSRGGV